MNRHWRRWHWRWQPYVPVYVRRHRAARVMARLEMKGKAVSPVHLEGRRIAHTFWGKAWCANLEHYSDFSNRLPRGRTYVRNGSVLDLQIGPGAVKALVSGRRLYTVAVKVAAVPKVRWSSICRDCTGEIDSLVELLQGQFSTAVMERLCQQKTGLFPAPAEIRFSCSCPDWASMCKHVAAVLYGIGARLDAQPELLFKLRRVDEEDLITKAGRGMSLSAKGPAAHKILAAESLAEIFGLEIAGDSPAPALAGQRSRSRAKAKRLPEVTAPAPKAGSTARARKTRAPRMAPSSKKKQPKTRGKTIRGNESGVQSRQAFEPPLTRQSLVQGPLPPGHCS